MPSYKLRLLTFIFLYFSPVIILSAQTTDSIYKDNIKTVKFYNYGDQLSMPVINLNTSDETELQFDDLDADVKYYYYTFQLCNRDWSPANISQFDYLKGFTQMRINNYRTSSIAFTRYTHYDAIIPDRNCIPIHSGNFLLKVFLDGDTNKLVFTKRLLVLDSKCTIAARITQPFLPDIFRTHQKVELNIDVKSLNAYNANQQVKVVILQNSRWDNALKDIAPTFVRGNTLQYNTENTAVFPGGKEWRWLDLRDFHLQSDRIKSADYKRYSTDMYVKPDVERSGQKYVYFQDLNGKYIIETTQSINPFWQSDYATVHFSLAPPNNQPYSDKDVYLFGELSNYNFPDSLKMNFNTSKGLYETSILLKEGYYSYTYMGVDKNNFDKRSEVDGNYYETENTYTILVYYRDFTARADELIGVSSINSRTDVPGFSF